MKIDAKELQQELTDKFIKMIEEGQADPKGWKKPWVNNHMGMATRATGFYVYTGMNQLLLSLTADYKGWSNVWATPSQWKKLAKDNNLKLDWRGQHCEMSVYRPLTRKFTKEEQDDNGNTNEVTITQVYAYDAHKVLNASQVKGSEAILSQLNDKSKTYDHDPIEAAEKFIKGIEHNVEFNHNQAAYSPIRDTVKMPNLNQFVKAEDYYATYLHELTHWTGHSSRLDRLGKWAKADYAKEELVAEFGASMLTRWLGVKGEHMDNHANYLAGWLTVLKNDTKFLLQASTKAYQAFELLCNEAKGKKKQEAA